MRFGWRRRPAGPFVRPLVHPVGVLSRRSCHALRCRCGNVDQDGTHPSVSPRFFLLLYSFILPFAPILLVIEETMMGRDDGHDDDETK